jgi:hypothetical protein
MHLPKSLRSSTETESVPRADLPRLVTESVKNFQRIMGILPSAKRKQVIPFHSILVSLALFPGTPHSPRRLIVPSTRFHNRAIQRCFREDRTLFQPGCRLSSIPFHLHETGPISRATIVVAYIASAAVSLETSRAARMEGARSLT